MSAECPDCGIINCGGGCVENKTSVSAVASNDGLSCPWDTLENPEDGCWANFIAWEEWMQAKDDRDLFDEIDILPRTFIYCMMVELVEAR